MVKFIPFFLISFIVLYIFYRYVTRKIIVTFNLLPWPAWFMRLFSLLLIILFYAPMVIRFTGVELPFIDSLAWFGYWGLGFYFLLLFPFLLIDVLCFIARHIVKLWLKRGSKKKYPEVSGLSEDKSSDKNAITRLDFLQTASQRTLAAAGLFFSFYGLKTANGDPSIITVNIASSRLGKSWHNLRIAQFSDLHIGPLIKRDFVQRVVSAINELDADIVVCTGDLVDGSVTSLAKDVAPLQNIKAKIGKFFVTGNHEYFSGVHSWLRKVSELGFTTLVNEHRVLYRGNDVLIVAGVADHRASSMGEGHESDVFASIRDAVSPAYRILLAHQPKSIYQATAAGFDLQLSGHTHGGQIYPFHHLVKLDQPYISGLHRFQQTDIYINRGTGYWGPPIRIGSDPEISLIILESLL